MKKLLLSATLLLSSAAIFAQNGGNTTPVSDLKTSTGAKTNTPAFNNENSNSVRKTLTKKAEVEGWYIPTDFVRTTAAGAGLKRSIAFVTADSNFQVIRDNGTVDQTSFQSFGQVLDPKDELMNLSDSHAGLLLDQWSDYTVDSILFQYCYLRNVDSTDNNQDGVNEEVIDTLFIAYFANSNIEKRAIVSDPKNKVGYLKWNVQKRFPASYLKVDTILIGNDRSNIAIDSTSSSDNETLFGSKFAQLSVGTTPISVTKNNLVGFTVTFKSGIPAIRQTDATTFDTAVVVYQGLSAFPANKRRANTFGLLNYFNEATSGNEYTNLDFYNTSEFQNHDGAYGLISNWSGAYLPGFLFTNDLFPETGFRCKSLNASVKENDLVAISSIFPNPASSSTTINFNLKKPGVVKISMVNIIGQEVSSINAGSLVAGNNTVSLDVNTLNAGVYFVNVTVDGVTTTKKLTVGQ